METMKKAKKKVSDTLKRQTSGAQIVGVDETRRHLSTLNKHWPHSPENLLYGKVEYQCKLIGKCEVARPRGADVVRDAMFKLQFQHTQKCAELGTAASKQQKVLLRICADEVSVCDKSSGRLIDKYPIYRVSFVTVDAQVPQIMAFIAERQTEQRCDCYVFYSSFYANEIARTLNESFDLAHQRYLNQRVDPTKDQQIANLMARVKALEEENSMLRQRCTILLEGMTQPVPPLPPRPPPPPPESEPFPSDAFDMPLAFADTQDTGAAQCSELIASMRLSDDS